MTRFQLGAFLWAVALAVGFGVVFTLGRPLPNEAELLNAAYHPAPPVTQAAAAESAATIVRIQYPDLADRVPTIQRRTDFDVERWVISYSSDGAVLNGVQISVAVVSGHVEVVTFP